MPTPTYTALATLTLGTSASSVTFSSIPSTYRDLIVIFDYEAGTLTYAQMRLNGDTGSNYSSVRMYGNGSVITSSGSDNRFYLSTPTILGGTRVFGISQLLDYSATDKHKTLINRLNSTNGGSSTENVEQQAARWANTAAVTSIEIFGNFASGATFNLYGVIA